MRGSALCSDEDSDSSAAAGQLAAVEAQQEAHMRAARGFAPDVAQRVHNSAAYQLGTASHALGASEGAGRPIR